MKIVKERTSSFLVVPSVSTALLHVSTVLGDIKVGAGKGLWRHGGAGRRSVPGEGQQVAQQKGRKTCPETQQASGSERFCSKPQTEERR